YEAINNSRISNAALSYNTVKTALADHFSKWGSLTSSNGNIISTGITNFDQILLAEGFLDKPFNVKLGSQSYIALPAAGLATDARSEERRVGKECGCRRTPNDAAGTAVVEAVII